MIKTILFIVGIIFLVSLITYIGGTIYLNIQQKKYNKYLEEEDK